MKVYVYVNGHMFNDACFKIEKASLSTFVEPLRVRAFFSYILHPSSRLEETEGRKEDGRYGSKD